MKQNNNIAINNNICSKHKEEYMAYCLECKIHLCQQCLKLGEHNYHYLINIIGILPNDEIKTKFKNLIDNSIMKLNDLYISKEKTKKN